MRTSTLTIAFVSALLVAGAGTGGALAATNPLQAQQSPTDTGTATTAPGAGTSTPAGSATGTTGSSGLSVTFNDQNSSGESVLVQSATLPQDGFVAIYDSTRSGNNTNQIIGVSYLLSAGTSDNIRIQLNESLNSSKSLTAVIHTDSNGNGQFDFVTSNGQQDPAPPAGDQRVVDIAQVTVQGSDTGGDSPTDSGGTTTANTGSGATEASGGTQTAASGASNGGTATGGTNGSGGGGSGSSGPGFGLVVAVVALLAVALLAVRRN